MNMHSRYPELIIDLNKLRQNVARVVQKCSDCGVEVAGVIKGCTGLPECAAQFERAGVRFMASSRLEQLEPLKSFDMQTPLMLIRIPMLSEAADVVRITDISLNSEVEVLRELDRQAGIQDRIHQVLLMVDLGDLREGFWDKDELLVAALMVENDLHNLHLAGRRYESGVLRICCCDAGKAAGADRLCRNDRGKDRQRAGVHFRRCYEHTAEDNGR